MRKLLVICLFPCSWLFSLNSQHLIDLPEDEIRKVMREEYPSFKLNTTMVNKTFNYLKYEDKFNEETLLVFLSDDNVCTFTRLMSEYGNMSTRISELNSLYQKTSDTTWNYQFDEEQFTVTYRKGEWFFTLVTKKSEEE